MRNLTIVIVLFLAVTNASALTAHKNLNITDLKKAAYKIDEIYKTKPRGIYYLDVPKCTDDPGPPIILSLHNYAFGDLNGDGLGDAVVLVGLNGGGTGQFMSLVALVNDHGKAKSVDYVTLGDRTGCTSLRIAHGKIIYRALVHAHPFGAAWGTVPKRLVYKLEKNKLVGPRHVDDDD